MWVWQKNTLKSHEEEWQQRLSSLPGAVFSASPAAGRLHIDVYCEDPGQALALQACWGGQCHPVETVDWVAATAPGNTPPLLIRQQLVLTSSDDPAALSGLARQYPRRVVMSFPAERAFGTGSHATTATCLRLLCDEAAQRLSSPWSVVDIGCGTGVLALAALKLGASHAVSFDFDPTAVEVARRNVERNGGAKGLHLFQADIFEWAPAGPAEQGDIVLANLFSTVLQKAFPRILPIMKPDASLIISGILNAQAQETLAAAKEAGLAVTKVVSRGKWTTAKLKRI